MLYAKMMLRPFLFALSVTLIPLPCEAAESVTVKYRGPVDLKPFQCQQITRSSFVQRVCYDKRERYMLINLAGTYYHYCEIPKPVVTSLLAAESLGRFYNAQIKGRFDCRVNRMPTYK